MTKQLTFFIFFLIVIKTHTQEKTVVISGKIDSDALSVENIHILNQNSHKGTISDKHGEFKIPVKINDTLIFSGVQFYEKKIKITKLLMRNKIITVQLFQKINELDEIKIKAHNLSGNLNTDANNVKDSVSKTSDGVLDFSMIDFSKPVVQDIDEFSRSRTSSDQQLVPGGGNILGLLSLVLDPLIEQINKIGARKKSRKNEERNYQKKVIDAPEKIISQLGESFFTETLHIPTEHIIPFLNHCKSKGIIDLHIKNRRMEVIDILFKESKSYLSTFKE